MFRPTTIVLPIAVMAFAIVVFLLFIDLSIYPPAGETTKPPVTNTAVTNKNTNTTLAKECQPTGCSGQVCSDEEVVSTCEYRSDYACYQGATCERQANGICGWTVTAELTTCLDAAKTPTGQVQGVDQVQSGDGVDETIRPELY